MIAITTERVRWFAAYHAAHPDWGVFHTALQDGNYDCGASDPGLREGGPPDLEDVADWFDRLTEDERIELARRVRTLEEVRSQDAPSAFTPAAWVREGTAVDEAIAGRLSESARRVFYSMTEANHAAGGAAVTIAEAMAGRTRNPNTFRIRCTELFYMGALIKGETRQCRVSRRLALTWTAVPPPWTPIPGGRATAATLRPLLREAADLLRRAGAHIERSGDLSRDQRQELLDLIRARAAEYQEAASNAYTLSERKDV
jgi:hypothetical protein